MEQLLLVVLAVAPPIAFLIYILRYDRVEPEPLGFVLKMLFLGCLSVVPAALVELLFMELPLFSLTGITGSALQSFLVIAPVEEAVKLLVVLLFAWKNRNFNEHNDGIVYTGTVSIGFAMAENVLYVLEHGLGTGIARALTSIPGHTFTGVIMGYFVGMARFAPCPSRRNGYLLSGFLMAWLLHGAYNTFALSGTEAALLVVPLVLAHFALGIAVLRKGRALSMARWVPGSPPGEPLQGPSSHGRGRRIVARVLLILSGLFWALVLTGVFLDPNLTPEDATAVVVGALILTAIPITLGVLLERSFRRRQTTGGVRS